MIRRSIGAIAALALTGVLVAGCASSPPSDPGSTAAPSGGTDSDKAELIAAAEALAEQFLTKPTELPGIEPITTPVPTGKKIYYISASGAAHIAQFDAVKQAADILGWEAVHLKSDGSAGAVQNDFQTAFRDGADGIIERFDSSLIAPSLQEAKERGIPVVGVGQNLEAGDELIYAAFRPAHNLDYGTAWASWLVADSQASAHVLYVILAGVPIYQATLDFFTGELDRLCGDGCSIDVLEVPSSTPADQIPNEIATAARRYPDANYIVMPVAAWATGLRAALQSAGIADKLKVIGANSVAATYPLIRNGEVTADLPFPGIEAMFLAMDAFARYYTDTPIDTDTEVPTWLITKDTVPDNAEDGLFEQVAGAVDQFKKAWGK